MKWRKAPYSADLRRRVGRDDRGAGDHDPEAADSMPGSAFSSVVVLPQSFTGKRGSVRTRP